MTIPKRFKIRGHTWRVRFVRELFSDDGKELLGGMDPEQRVISLTTPDPVVLIHEYIHAVLAEYRFCITSLTPDVEEFICEFVASELVSTFRLVKKSP